MPYPSNHRQVAKYVESQLEQYGYEDSQITCNYQQVLQRTVMSLNTDTGQMEYQIEDDDELRSLDEGEI